MLLATPPGAFIGLLFLVMFVVFPIEVYFRSHLRYPTSKGVPTDGALGWSRTQFSLSTDHFTALRALRVAFNSLGQRMPEIEGDVATIVVGSAWVRSPWNTVINVVGQVDAQPDGTQLVRLAARPRLTYGIALFAMNRPAQLLEQAARAIQDDAAVPGPGLIPGVVPE